MPDLVTKTESTSSKIFENVKLELNKREQTETAMFTGTWGKRYNRKHMGNGAKMEIESTERVQVLL